MHLRVPGWGVDAFTMRTRQLVTRLTYKERCAMGDIWIITTPILEGLKIKEYRGLTIAKSVRAVDIVRDFFTSFRDFVGGRSASYQEIMDEMQQEILEEIKEQARQMGANAIIGFRIDFDNIGSKGKSLRYFTDSVNTDMSATFFHNIRGFLKRT